MTTHDDKQVRKTPQTTTEPKFGSARTDYSKPGSGGDLDARGIQSESSGVEKRGHGEGQQPEHENESEGINKVLLLFGAAGVSAGLLYLLRTRKTESQTVKQDELMQAKCRDLMTADPSCCLPADSVNKAAQLMKTENVGAIPVVDDHQSRKLIGIVTDRDLALKVIAGGRSANNTTVADVMTSGVTVCRDSDALQKVLDEMSGQQLRRIPVVDDNNRIVGIIAQADLATRLEAPKATAEVIEEISRTAAAGR